MATRWRFIALRFVPWFAVLSLAWETAHVPLYTIWTEKTAAYVALAVAHCTAGDVMIGLAALLLALLLAGQGTLHERKLAVVAALTTALGTAYTVFSEWMNITLLRSWSYAEAMPRVALGRFELGLTPLLQWLLVPSIALLLARWSWRED